MPTIHHNPEIIKSWREGAGLSQTELAHHVSRSRPTISRTEEDDTPVSLDVIASIAAYFGKSLAEALNEEGRRKYGVAIAKDNNPQN